MYFKKMFVIFAVLFFVFFMAACYLPNKPDLPEKSYDQVEFMYQRTMPIISPNNPDPSGMTVWHERFGGGNPSCWSSIGPDQWVCSMRLDYDQVPYHIYLIDGKVISEYVSIARTIFARIHGQNDWIQLITIERHSSDEEAKFILDKNGIHATF